MQDPHLVVGADSGLWIKICAQRARIDRLKRQAEERTALEEYQAGLYELSPDSITRLLRHPSREAQILGLTALVVIADQEESSLLGDELEVLDELPKTDELPVGPELLEATHP